ncbi:MAG: SGNH/GDSL hydrolase family protein [Bacteroidia bacterium]|nr:SGNH/GDSL hydrolase family protein [Bacteroidia bacterium]
MNDWDAFYLVTLTLPLLLAAALWFLFRRKRAIKQVARMHLVAWNAGLTLFLTSLLFLGGETYFRFFVDRTDAFGLKKTTQKWAKRYYHFNNLRARDNQDYLLKPQEGKLRISFFGDSFTAGHGVKRVDDRFVNLIRKTHPEWEVHCLAANGMDSVDELEMLDKLHEVDGYEYQVVVLVYNLNDIAQLVPEMQAMYARIRDFSANEGYLTRESYLVNELVLNRFASREEGFANYQKWLLEAYQGSVWEQQKQILRDFKQHSLAYGQDLMVVTFPFLQEDGGKFDPVYEQMGRFWAAEGVPNLDLRTIFENNDASELVVNAQDAHPNELAHRLAASPIAVFLQAFLH